MVVCHVGRYSVQPGVEIVITRPGERLAVEFEEDLLRHVFGFLATPDKPEEQAVDPVIVPVKQGLKGADISLPETFYENIV
jgi:hypothetical protein